LTRTIFSPTLDLPYFRTFFYINGIKDIPINVFELLTPIALAILIIDDGHFDHGGIYLNTQSYSETGVNYLVEAPHPYPLREGKEP